MGGALGAEPLEEPHVRERTEHLGREDLTAGDADRIREILRTSGALASTQALIDAHRNVALAALAATQVLPAHAVAALTELADLAIVRES